MYTIYGILFINTCPPLSGICLICLPKGPGAEGTHIRQIMSAHVATFM